MQPYAPPPSNRLYPRLEALVKVGWLLAGVVVVFLGYVYWLSRNPAQPNSPHFSRPLRLTADGAVSVDPAVSHNGRLLAYASDRDGAGPLAIWIRPLAGGDAKRLTHSAFDESVPDFSPDDTHIVFRSEQDGGGIYVTPISGHDAPKRIASRGVRPRYSPDGQWIAYFDDRDRIYVVSSAGGESRWIQPKFSRAQYPVWSADSKHLLFEGTRRDGGSDWWVTPVVGTRPVKTHAFEALQHVIEKHGPPEGWIGDKVLFSAAIEGVSHLWELPVSTSDWQVSGPARQVTGGPGQERSGAMGPRGFVVFPRPSQTIDLWSIPAHGAGSPKQLTADAGTELPSVSANGKRVVYVSGKRGIRDVWIQELDHGQGQALTAWQTIRGRPMISRDGTRCVYTAIVDGKCSVFLKRVSDGSTMQSFPGCAGVWDWSRDGANLVVFNPESLSSADLLSLSSGQKRPLLSDSDGLVFHAQLSPDSRWIAFASGSDAASARIMVAPARGKPIPRSKWIPIASEAASSPVWSEDGGTLYYRSNRDGFNCIWAQKLGTGKRPASEPTAVYHFHSARFGLRLLEFSTFHMSLAKDYLVLNLAKTSSDLWMAQSSKH